VPRFSMKAIILSNLTHWGAFVFGVAACMIVYIAAATIATDGANATSIVDEMRSSVGLSAMSLAVAFAAPLLGGYVGAKLAPQAKSIHGVLATSSWLLFVLYGAIWGLDSTDHPMLVPEWLNTAVSYGAPLSAWLGARLYLRRQMLTPGTAARAQDAQGFTSQAAAPEQQTSGADSKSRGMLSSRIISTFVFVVVSLLFTQHQKSMLLLAMVGATAILLVLLYVEKKFKSMRS
jgi:hypothetical protein